jgi:membrane-bound serine protease (ClpP class)
MGALFTSGAAAYGVLRLAPRTRAGRALVLSEVVQTRAERAPQVGAEGVAVTALRPSGAAEILGQRWDVVTDGLFVEPGRAVRVARVEGSRVVVEPV